MLADIAKLLILQDRDRRISEVESELANIEPERSALQQRRQNTQLALESARRRAMQIESDRQKLELDVAAKKQQIEKYSLQQFQTKKNEEYRALAHEIDTCRSAIATIEDRQLELMEAGESAQKAVLEAHRQADEAEEQIDAMIADLVTKKSHLRKQLEELRSGHDDLGAAVDSSILNRYERLRRQKGSTSVVGVAHGVCGGCHMKLPTHIVHACIAGREVVSCPNCSRLLYLGEK
jgi:hypothetical protein